MKNADMPAMPVTDEFGMPFNSIPEGLCTTGLTKREMMAMHIFSSMQGRDGVCNIEHEVTFAVVAADHLLAELESTK